MTDSVAQTVAPGPAWPTVDPFLFCAHHDDAYPAGDEQLGPAASLAGRDLGRTSPANDGWSMYHGLVVPGFPQHPHRGFETVTFVRRGLIDHADSLGATARFGRGDVQWLTAGGGVVHSEMFPLLDRSGANPLELFQIWLNLPADRQARRPVLHDAVGRDIPRVGGRRRRRAHRRGDGRSPARSAGSAAAPPPDSWAAPPDADVAIWHLRLEPGRDVGAAAAGRRPTRCGCCTSSRATRSRVDGHRVGADTGRGARRERSVALTAGRRRGRVPACSRAARSASPWPSTARS